MSIWKGFCACQVMQQMHSQISETLKYLNATMKRQIQTIILQQISHTNWTHKMIVKIIGKGKMITIKATIAYKQSQHLWTTVN